MTDDVHMESQLNKSVNSRIDDRHSGGLDLGLNLKGGHRMAEILAIFLRLTLLKRLAPN